MKACFVPLILICLFTACADDVENNNPAAPATELPDSTNKAKQFFPILDFMRGELKNIGTFATAIKTYTTIGNKTDSGYIKPEEFNSIMQEYLPAELNKENFERYYTESSFFDETTQTSNFTYSTKNDELDFHRVDVLVQGSETFDKVSSVFMAKFNGNDDSSVVKNMLLTPGKSVLVNSEITTRGKKETRQDKYLWNWE
ncbi:MAG: hypothetical protein ABW036_01535 [Flavitalea sp.]